jgi:hypothetical protein
MGFVNCMKTDSYDLEKINNCAKVQFVKRRLGIGIDLMNIFNNFLLFQFPPIWMTQLFYCSFSIFKQNVKI